ncbi:tol-pal system-associated acyl-CoA thioesterase [Phytohalomonas tamaricis]|uniref:tol-pal system-associated acyl-CoA thioesterase n=1 Tax=Phytohalomonas tamaricis TaxID=2081032 RepID=UPI000D0B2491|nr:tol-pal system-associated acyl-CoA thioesterase [Phytohalomonas tamaricis]
MTFELPVTVYIEDTDAGGIVYHANYLNFMERARTEWLRSHGFTQQSLLQNNIQLVVRRLTCRFAKPAKLDDTLGVTADIKASSHCAATFQQYVLRRGERLCDAEVDIACIDASRLKPTRWPDALRKALSNTTDPQHV